MATEDGVASDLTYRQQTVHETLSEHDSRISKNEKRWLIAKGALIMLALTEGTSYGIDAVGSII